MRLRDMLDETVVKTDLESSDKEECFEEMVDVLVRAGRLTDRAAAIAAIKKREAEASTGIGFGVAVPHGKCPEIKELTIALGTSKNGVEFDADDGRLVNVVILILASSSEPGRHLQALAEVVRLVRIPGLCDKIIAAPDAAAVLGILEKFE